MHRNLLPRAIVLFIAAAIRTPAQETSPQPVTPTRAPELELPCIEAPSDGTLVTVVDAMTKKPVAGAIVTWFEERRDTELDDGDDLVPEPGLSMRRRTFGKSVKCGADGTTRVGRFTSIVASSGDRYGGSSRPTRSRSLVLSLEPRRSVTVHVVDRDGKPVAEVPIELRTGEESSGATKWHVTTDANGDAEIGPLDLFASVESSARRGLWVAVDAPLGAPIRAHFSLADLPAKPIDLTLPPTGELVIDVVDADGRSIEGLGYTNVRERYELEKDLPDDPPNARWPAVGWGVYDRSSHHELPHVELGLRFVVDSKKDGREDARQLVDGPTKPGETKAVRLVVPEAPASRRLRGRILDEKGDPLAGATVELAWSSDATRVSRGVVARGATGADGRLDLPLECLAGGRYEEEIAPWLEAIVPRPDGDGILASGMIALPKTREFGGGDFGDIRLHPSPLFASGVIVDDAGTPVAGAEIRVTVTPKDADILSGDFTDGLLTATSKADGRFTVWGDVPDGNVEISAEPGSVERPVPLAWSSEPHDHAAGSTDLRFVLWRCGTIVAHVISGDDEVERLSYSSSTTRSDGAHVGGSTGGFNDEGDAEIEIPIGIARLAVSRGGTVIAVRDRIGVRPGAVVELEPIELAAAAHRLELTIVDELGKPVPSGWIVMPNAEEEKHIADVRKMFGPERSAFFPFPRRPDVTTFKDGKVTLRSDRPLPPFAVGAAGRTAVVLRHPASAERVVLEPAPRVALVLEYEGDPVPEPLVFYASIAAGNDDEEWFRFGPDRMSGADSRDVPRLDGITLERDQPVDLPIRCLGKTRLDLVLGEKSPGGYGGAIFAGDPGEIDVARTRERQIFHVKVARPTIDQVLEQRWEQQKQKKQDG